MTEEAKWPLNLQTILMLGSIAGVLVTGGYTLSNLQSATDRNTQAVSSLTTGLERNDGATAQLELRVEHVEKIAEDAVKLRRELDVTLGSMKADIAVMKDILQRGQKVSP
jgi:hypothetical protein